MAGCQAPPKNVIARPTTRPQLSSAVRGRLALFSCAALTKCKSIGICETVKSGHEETMCLIGTMSAVLGLLQPANG